MILGYPEQRPGIYRGERPASDRLEQLEDEIAAAETLTPKGKAHPALVEARQQQIVLARLIASLRIPDADDEQPQRRGAARGAYGLRVDGE